MRVNVYAEETTDRIEIIEKEVEGQTFTALRFYLELPVTTPHGEVRGPFMHRPGDDDSAAVTFWGKRDLRTMLGKALDLLNEHYAKRGHPPIEAAFAPPTRPFCKAPKAGEPYFVLKGGDALSADLVEKWATEAHAMGCPSDKVNEARQIAQAMREYPSRRPD